MAQIVYIVVLEKNPTDEPSVFQSRLDAFNCAILSMSGDDVEYEDEDEAEEKYNELVEDNEDAWLVVSSELL